MRVFRLFLCLVTYTFLFVHEDTKVISHACFKHYFKNYTKMNIICVEIGSPWRFNSSNNRFRLISQTTNDLYQLYILNAKQRVMSKYKSLYWQVLWRWIVVLCEQKWAGYQPQIIHENENGPWSSLEIIICKFCLSLAMLDL